MKREKKIQNLYNSVKMGNFWRKKIEEKTETYENCLIIYCLSKQLLDMKNAYMTLNRNLLQMALHH